MSNIEISRVDALNLRISYLKSKLHNTDYIAIKFFEGEITASEFAPTKELRRTWRAEINVLEAELELLKAEEVLDE